MVRDAILLRGLLYKIPIGGVLTPSADKNSGRSRVNGCGIYASRLDTRCRELSYARSSGPLPKNRLLCWWLRKIHLRSMARGTGQQRLDAPLDASELMPSPCRRMGNSAAQRGQACG